MDNAPDSDVSAGEGHSDHSEPVDTLHLDGGAPEPEVVATSIGYEELAAHAQSLEAADALAKSTIAQLNEQAAHQSAIIADLNEQIAAMAATVTDFRNEAVITQHKLDERAASVDDLTIKLTDATTKIVEFNRQRDQYKLYAVRLNGDRTDRMVLAEDAARAAEKVPGAERITLAASTLVW